MAYISQELISKAYSLSGIVGEGYQTLTAQQIQTGLERLNGFIQIKGGKTKLISYYKDVMSQLEVGIEKYFLPGLVELSTITFFLNSDPNSQGATSVRFPMQQMTQYQYFATARAEKIITLPYCWHLERVMGGANLYVYFLPDKPYVYQIIGKYALNSTTLNQDLSLIYDEWYLEYLRYGLAIYLCEWNGIIPPPSVEKTFREIEQDVTTLNPIDFTFRKRMYFGNRGGMNWGTVNYGKGWTNR